MGKGVQNVTVHYITLPQPAQGHGGDQRDED